MTPSDMALIKACCEAMGFRCYVSGTGILFAVDYLPPNVKPRDYPYNPLIYDDQAMRLAKAHHLSVTYYDEKRGWFVWKPASFYNAGGLDLNRAIVECVAKMNKEKR